MNDTANKFFYRGRPIEELSREELEAACIRGWRKYHDLLGQSMKQIQTFHEFVKRGDA